MALENTSDNYDILWVAPLMIKQNILRNIDVQIERARRGEKCGLFFKTNSITDKEVIDKLVEASQAGVPIDLFVRGIGQSTDVVSKEMVEAMLPSMMVKPVRG